MNPKKATTGYLSFDEFGATKGGKVTFQSTICSWVALNEK